MGRLSLLLYSLTTSSVAAVRKGVRVRHPHPLAQGFRRRPEAALQQPQQRGLAFLPAFLAAFLSAFFK
jgi:hypothetical protein